MPGLMDRQTPSFASFTRAVLVGVLHIQSTGVNSKNMSNIKKLIQIGYLTRTGDHSFIFDIEHQGRRS